MRKCYFDLLEEGRCSARQKRVLSFVFNIATNARLMEQSNSVSLYQS